VSYGNVLNSEHFLVGQYQHLKLGGDPNQPASTEGVRPPGASYGACIRLDCIPACQFPVPCVGIPTLRHQQTVILGQHPLGALRPGSLATMRPYPLHC